MKTFLLSLFLLLLISGCGGGGGSNATTQNTPSVPIDQQAKIDSSSVEDFLAGIQLNISNALVIDVVDLFISGSLTYQTGNVDINLINSCGGSVHVSGSLDETLSTGLLTLNFSNYQECMINNTHTFTSTVDLSIFNTEMYTSGGNITIPSGFLLSTNNLQLNIGSASVAMNGTLEFSHDTSDPQYNWPIYTKNFTLSNSTGSATFIDFIKKDYTSKGDLYLWGGFGSSYSGRLHDSDAGYADITTVNAAVICTSIGQNCPLDPTVAGRIKVSGDNSSALVKLGSNISTIRIDSDGNGVYEQVLNY